jgi:hypothetical protein
MISFAAASGSPLYDSTVRSPAPLTIITIELPAAHPGRFTISRTMDDKSGVCHFASTTGQEGMLFQATWAVVRARLEILLFVVVNVNALSTT